ncbi:Uma2 family endonuclease [Pleurocapsa sp. FMAR1]|uniref:Uma2 family endonuclease n=1 Tax=Pleurocapsa sp. FMAR1 TaxID=3040204 RepID=UPI0029C87C75|nr:Uma2 family endonuclease [Pleurocapsa sp. FMAR1]
MKTRYKWTVADYHQLIETGLLEGKPVELLEGELIEMSPEGIPHSYTNDSVVKYLRRTLRGLADVKESHPITLDNSEPEPDIVIVRLPEEIYKQHHPYPEDIYWLIEVSNRTLEKDLKEKTITYARNGIPEYWVIDLPNKKLWVFAQSEKSVYRQTKEFTTGTVSLQSFPNVSIELKHLLLY